MTIHAVRGDFQMDWHVMWPDVALAENISTYNFGARELWKKIGRVTKENIAWNKMCNKIEIIFIAETSICLKIKGTQPAQKLPQRAPSPFWGPPPLFFSHVHELPFMEARHRDLPQSPCFSAFPPLHFPFSSPHPPPYDVDKSTWQSRTDRSPWKKKGGEKRGSWMDIDLNRYFAVELIWRKINLAQVNNPFVHPLFAAFGNISTSTLISPSSAFHFTLVNKSFV